MKKAIYMISTILIASISIVSYNIWAGTGAGTSSDPVVSKSYVDARINEIKNLIGGNTVNTNNTTTPTVGTNTIDNTSKQQIVDEVLGVINALYGDKLENLDKYSEKPQETTPVAPETTEDPAFLPVFLSKGQKLIGGEGAEIIFRSGKATAYSENEMGVIDVSSGTELLNGANLSVNHLLIIGRNDGRGVYAVEDTWIMIKGSYKTK